jgi:hypothetical protein
VVSQCDHVRTGREQALGELGRQPSAVGGVLAVDDAERDAQLVAQVGKAPLQRAPPRGAEDVCDEKDSQGTAAAAAAG